MLTWVVWVKGIVIFVHCWRQLGCVCQKPKNLHYIILGPAIPYLDIHLQIIFGHIPKGVYLSHFLTIVYDIKKKTQNIQKAQFLVKYFIVSIQYNTM